MLSKHLSHIFKYLIFKLNVEMKINKKISLTLMLFVLTTSVNLVLNISSDADQIESEKFYYNRSASVPGNDEVNVQHEYPGAVYGTAYMRSPYTNPPGYKSYITFIKNWNGECLDKTIFNDWSSGLSVL